MLSSGTQAAIQRAIEKSCFPDTCTISAPAQLFPDQLTEQLGRCQTSRCRYFAAEERYYQREGTFVLSTSFRFEVPASTEIEVGYVVTVDGKSYTVDRVLGLRLDGETHVKAVRLRAEK